MPESLTIVGGGLAGLTLGIALRQMGIPVVICERGAYPRHRVCGEFISGRGLETLKRLGLLELLVDAGARPALTTAFYSVSKSFPTMELPEAALCLSRFEMDALLARRFCELGGALQLETHFKQKAFGEGVVRASGRRVQPLENGLRWFGIKAHAKKISLDADLEMHLGRNGYVGLCRLRDNEVNVCALVRRRADVADVPQTWMDRLRGTPGTLLYERLERADWDVKSFCSVAGLPLRPDRRSDPSECRIGDALTMIPPVTGNGMSMAFESAEIAVEPLAAYARGELLWVEAQQMISGRCDRAFARRLLWARWLQEILIRSSTRSIILRIASRWPPIWRTMFQLTR
jgi:flavin-dependent dehydrogenase